MARLYFIRHGETDWNRQGRLQGRTETSLNARGRRQAARAAHHLLDLPAMSAARLADMTFHVSPMRRTRETVEILRGTAGLEPAAYQPEERLREIAFGTWEGRTWPEIRARDPIGARARDKDRWCFVPPGGESYADVFARVQPWFDTLHQDTCVVAHGGVARVMMVLLGGLTQEQALEADIWQGKVLLFEEGEMRWLPIPGHG
jgi:broad specificity phosphatase PhoE